MDIFQCRPVLILSTWIGHNLNSHTLRLEYNNDLH